MMFMFGRGTWNRTTVSGFGDLRTKLYRTLFSIYIYLFIGKDVEVQPYRSPTQRGSIPMMVPLFI
jgi:hypothetical protein